MTQQGREAAQKSFTASRSVTVIKFLVRVLLLLNTSMRAGSFVPHMHYEIRADHIKGHDFPVQYALVTASPHPGSCRAENNDAHSA